MKLKPENIRMHNSKVRNGHHPFSKKQMKYNSSTQTHSLQANKNEGMFHFLKNTRQLEIASYIFS